MSHAPPAADGLQSPTWIAFSRSERMQIIAKSNPALIRELGYCDERAFLTSMACCVDADCNNILTLVLNDEVAPTISARELCCAFFLHQRDYFLINSQQHATCYQTIKSHVPANSPLHGYALYLECVRLIYQGNESHVEETIEVRSTETHSMDSGVVSIWIDTLLDFAIGEAAFKAGNFKLAHEKLAGAHGRATGLDFSCAIRIQFILARLLRESGQHSAALSLWCDSTVRARLASWDDSLNTVITHLNAAQCAMDDKNASRAKEELDCCSSLLKVINNIAPRLQGFQYLREGELATLEERYEDGERLLRQALDFFRTVEPPCHEGLLETKIALGTYALFQDDMRMAWAIIRSLIEEASERGCFPMRSRALLLQTWFFISSDPPTRAAFDNVLERIHMIQNPALMMHALGNLLSYAVNHLEESDRDHLLHRIRGLQGVLEESCYEKLYEQHVTSRFAPAMEERFERKSDENDPEYMVENG